ncbi:Lsr2 family DNA-binding protein [Acrocarpospora phusangensis]
MAPTAGVSEVSEIERQHIREWARTKGYQIADRGRIPAWIVDGHRRDHAAAPTGENPGVEADEVLDEDEFLDLLRGSG